VAAVDRHHVGRERIEEQGDVRRVVGQRRNGIGLVRVGNQTDLAASEFLQQRRDLGPRLQQARGRQVVREDRTRQVQRDHQRRPRLPQRLFALAPARRR
jgi:hypothetical protein